jgi:hypothetical protein
MEGAHLLHESFLMNITDIKRINFVSGSIFYFYFQQNYYKVLSKTQSQKDTAIRQHISEHT